jgi:lipoprotein-anchoring transpeptidase ErfK/SrfK
MGLAWEVIMAKRLLLSVIVLVNFTFLGNGALAGEMSPRTAGWTVRTISEAELERLSEKDRDLYPLAAKEILARLNNRAYYHVGEDIRQGRPLKVPRNFSLYKNWTVLPGTIPALAHIPKFILLVKDNPFLGWYENGRLVRDSHVCVGREDGWTRAGIYRVLNKDKDHVSRSYTNAYGEPAPMPWALRIYEHVWIHAGDIERGNCSHGCINLPWFAAIDLFNWADNGTVVMIVDSAEGLQAALARNRTNCTLYAQACERPSTRVD